MLDYQIAEAVPGVVDLSTSSGFISRPAQATCSWDITGSISSVVMAESPPPATVADPPFLIKLWEDVCFSMWYEPEFFVLLFIFVLFVGIMVFFAYKDYKNWKKANMPIGHPAFKPIFYEDVIKEA